MIEIGLFACVFATMFGFVRIFGDHGYLGHLAVVAVIASVLAALLRRRGVGPVAAVVIHSAVGLVAISNVYLSEYTTSGLPTPHTITTAYSMIVAEASELRVAVPPVAATTGLMVLLAVLMWTLVMFADSAAMRVHAPVQAVAPLVVVFVAVGVSRPGFDRLVSVIVFAASIGLYALTVGYSHHRILRWAGPAGATRSGPVRLSTSGFAMSMVVLVALAAAAMIPPDSEPVVTLRHRNDNSGREVVSPFVSIRSLLGSRSDVPMFHVVSDIPSYWRLTALDTYDSSRDIWISSGQYRKVGSQLPTTTDVDVATLEVDQHFEVLGIGGPWIPTIFEAGRYHGEPSATFNSATSTLFADTDLMIGQTYEITSAVPAFAVGDLARAVRPTFDDIDENLLRVPVESDIEREFLDGITAEHDGLYDMLIALQNTLRSDFVYSEDVDYSDHADPIGAFLTDRSGFCQQFSSVFAVMARRLGLPSRVAVGFTMGEPDAYDEAVPGPDDARPDGGTDDTDDRTDHRFLVRGRHAHAWPEVYFKDLGWVSFEPTPGRGNPATAAYTGIAASQVDTEPDGDPPGTTVVTTPDAAAAEDAPTTTVPPETDTSPSEPGTSRDEAETTPDAATSRSRPLVGTGIVMLLLVAGTMVILGRRRRRRHADASSDAADDPESVLLAGAWTAALRALEDLALRPMPIETPSEFAGRVAEHLGQGDMGSTDPGTVIIAGVRELASTETLRRYSRLFKESHPPEPALVADLIDRSERTAVAIADAVAVLGTMGTKSLIDGRTRSSNRYDRRDVEVS